MIFHCILNTSRKGWVERIGYVRDDDQNVLSPVLTIFAASSVLALWLAVNHKPVSLHLILLLVVASIFSIKWLSCDSSILAYLLSILGELLIWGKSGRNAEGSAC